MASRNLSIKIFITIAQFFLAAAAPLWAQNSGNYVELRFVQRISWTIDEYAMRYEVIIEKDEAGKYGKFYQSLTEANFIEVSLSPGKFRCQVVPHDFFDKPITVTEWVEFEVRPGDDYLTTGEHELIMVNPGDKTNRKEIILATPQVPTTPETEAGLEADPAAEAIPETEAAPDGKMLTGHTRQFDLYLGAAYVPLFPIYSDNQLFGNNLSPLGLSARFCAVSARQGLLNPGMELVASWRIYQDGGGQAVHSTAFDIYALAQTRFPNGRAALNLRAGAGLSLLPKNLSTSPDGQYSIHVNMGISLMWLFMVNFYMEGGVDYAQFFTEDYFGFLRPWIGLGYRF